VNKFTIFYAFFWLERAVLSCYNRLGILFISLILLYSFISSKFLDAYVGALA